MTSHTPALRNCRKHMVFLTRSIDRFCRLMPREVWAFPTSITLRLTWPLSWTMLQPPTGTVSLQQQAAHQDHHLCRAQLSPTLAALPLRAPGTGSRGCADRHSLLRRLSLRSAHGAQRVEQHPLPLGTGP